MLKSTNKRLIAFLLATMMLISSAPLSVLAVADEFTSNHTDHDHNTETNETLDINDFEETTLLKEVKSQIDAILDKYLGGRVMTAEDVESAVWDMSDDDLISAWEESEALRVKAEPKIGRAHV